MSFSMSSSVTPIPPLTFSKSKNHFLTRKIHFYNPDFEEEQETRYQLFQYEDIPTADAVVASNSPPTDLSTTNIDSLLTATTTTTTAITNGWEQFTGIDTKLFDQKVYLSDIDFSNTIQPGLSAIRQSYYKTLTLSLLFRNHDLQIRPIDEIHVESPIYPNFKIASWSSRIDELIRAVTVPTPSHEKELLKKPARELSMLQIQISRIRKLKIKLYKLLVVMFASFLECKVANTGFFHCIGGDGGYTMMADLYKLNNKQVFGKYGAKAWLRLHRVNARFMAHVGGNSKNETCLILTLLCLMDDDAFKNDYPHLVIIRNRFYRLVCELYLDETKRISQ